MNDLPARRALAVRRNRGKLLLPEWVKGFAEASGLTLTPNDFLPLDETEQLKRRFVERLQEEDVSYGEWPVRDRDDVIGYLRALSAVAGHLNVVLFSSADEFIGAARVWSDAVLAQPIKTWDVVEADLSLATEDLASGLCLEMNYYTRNHEYVKDGVYALTRWGVFSAEPLG
jgi:hypothetical protein